MRLALRLVPVVLSSLLLAAHFLRTGDLAWTVACAAFPLVLLARRSWAVRVAQAGLLAAAGVWGATAVTIAGARLESGAPWLRMAVILGAVATVALAGVLVLQARSTRSLLVRDASPGAG